MSNVKVIGGDSYTLYGLLIKTMYDASCGKNIVLCCKDDEAVIDIFTRITDANYKLRVSCCNTNFDLRQIKFPAPGGFLKVTCSIEEAQAYNGEVRYVKQ